MIDALRYDFIFESALNHEGENVEVRASKIRMPFVNRLLKEGKAKPFKLNAKPPTVTMPRLKSLLSGIIPEFIGNLFHFYIKQEFNLAVCLSLRYIVELQHEQFGRG